MAVYPSENVPWPAQTSAPSTSYLSPKQKRSRNSSTKRRRTSRIFSRQTVTDESAIANAKTQCQVFSGNQIISCFPTSDVVIPQHQFAGFVWNSNRPELTQTDSVNIYVFTGDSLQPIVNYYNQPNPTDQAGYITAQVNDTWFGTRGEQWSGKNISLPFYWVITRSDATLDGSEIPQATFTAVQTTYLDSVASSMSSSSSAAAAASSSSAAAASSASASSASSASGASLSSQHGSGSATSGSSPTGGVQQANAKDTFPKWAIAVIVVLGFLAILAAGILAFFFVRRLRRREESSNRGSMGSASPMMANVQGNSAQAPFLGGAGLAAAGAAGGAAASEHHRASSIVSPDGASSISHGGSAGEGGPFSGADAAIMADAFRKALRKPDFAKSPVEEGESPGSDQPTDGELMNRELAEEGRDIRSVESSRGVQVETLSDAGETAQDH